MKQKLIEMARKASKDLGIDKAKQTYIQMKRSYGEGELRVGRSITFTEDVYALCFVMQLRDDILE